MLSGYDSYKKDQKIATERQVIAPNIKTCR